MRDTEAGHSPYITADPIPEPRILEGARPRAWGYEPTQQNEPFKPL